MTDEISPEVKRQNTIVAMSMIAAGFPMAFIMWLVLP